MSASNPKPIETHINEVIEKFGLNQIGTVTGTTVRDGKISLSLELDPTHKAKFEKIKEEAQAALASYPSISKARITAMAKHEDKHTQEQASDCSSGGCGGCPSSGGCGSANKEPEPPILEGIKSVIAVASGKGGVGKSTTSVNLAVSLAKQGLKVGLLDADIYGPSLGMMLGHKGGEIEVKDNRPQPVEAYGLKTMSLSYMLKPEQAVVWRGPMIMSAISQFLKEVEWGELDVLVIDMPPGTGDAQITLAQVAGEKLKTGGAIVVSTPQDIALLDARRALTMFRDTDIPILGLIENMSVFVCPHCGESSHIFGDKGCEKEAEKKHIPFLGSIPLTTDIRMHSDSGKPITVEQPNGDIAKAYDEIAQNVVKSLKKTGSL